MMEEGIIKKAANFEYDYYLKDHLGSTRVVFNSTTGRKQTNEYYPFGMLYTPRTVATSKYLYNGKEIQDDVLSGTALDWYDYGARFYDPQIGRWHSIDPASEIYTSYSPYNYALNNPVSNTDPNGMDVSFGGGPHGGDYYTGEDAQVAFSMIKAQTNSSSNSYNDNNSKNLLASREGGGLRSHEISKEEVDKYVTNNFKGNYMWDRGHHLFAILNLLKKEGSYVTSSTLEFYLNYWDNKTLENSEKWSPKELKDAKEKIEKRHKILSQFDQIQNDGGQLRIDLKDGNILDVGNKAIGSIKFNDDYSIKFKDFKNNSEIVLVTSGLRQGWGFVHAIPIPNLTIDSNNLTLLGIKIKL
jgi:RHS repeat-associated protein